MPQEHTNQEDVPGEQRLSAVRNVAPDTQQQHAAPDWAALFTEGVEEVRFSVDREWRFTYLNNYASIILGRTQAELLGKVLWEAFPTLIGTSFEQLYRQAMADGKPARLEDYSFTRQAWYEVRAYPIPPGLLIYFQDITARKLAEAEIQRQSERAHIQADVSRALAEATYDYQSTVDIAAQLLSEIIGDGCIIRLLSPDGDTLELSAVYHPDPEAVALVRHILTEQPPQVTMEELSGRVIFTGQSFLMPVLSMEQLKATTGPKQWAYFERFPFFSALATPLHAAGRVIGAISMTRHTPGHSYTEDDLSLVQDLADRVAIAITNARLFQQVQNELAERVKTEAALRISEERFKVLSGATNEALFIHENGIIVEANQRATQMFGYSLDELIGMSIEQLISPEDLAALRERIARNTSEMAEAVALHKNGTRFIVESQGRPIIYQGKRMLLVALRDTTDLKQAEEALRASEARLTGIIASAMDAIISIDESRRIVIFNTAAERMFRCSAATVIGQSLDQFLPVSIRHIHAQHIHTFGQTGSTTRSMTSLGTLTAIRANGEEFPIEATISHTLAAGQRLYTVIIRDITERKQAEETLQKTQAQLLQSQKMESIGLLAGGIAHDFNNLLNVIIGYCDLILAILPQTNELYDDMLEIQKAGNRAATLVRQILAFSRQQVLDPQLVNLNETVENMDTLLHRVIGEDIELVSMLDPHLDLVMVDPGQIEQVIINLAVNARDAMPDGGLLTIETATVELDEQYRSAGHPEVTTGTYVMLAVSDTGIGMDQATQEKIFEPFFTTKEQGKGTGLGLSTVYGIVRQSEGHIWVYSEPGFGTTFKVYIPIAEELSLEESPVPSDTQQPLATSLAAMSDSGQGRTILVVEDDPLVWNLIHRVLSQAGYTILKAQNGQEALDVLASYASQIDAVLTDIVMPQMGGRTLVERLKEEWAYLKVLCMSGYTDRAVIRHGMVRPCDTFLQKPFTPATLLRRIDDVLNNVGEQ